MYTETKKAEGIEIAVSAEVKPGITVDKILQMAKADPEILEALRNLNPNAEADPKTEKAKKEVIFEENKLKNKKSPEMESSSDEEKDGKVTKKKLTYAKEVKRITKSIEEEFREKKISLSFDDNFVPPPTPDGKTYFDSFSDAESVDEEWFRDELGFADRKILDEHLEYISDTEIPELPKGGLWSDEENRGNRYKYLMHIANLESRTIFENYIKLLKYTDKREKSFAEERSNFAEELEEKNLKIKDLETKLEKAEEKFCPLVSCYEIQVYKMLKIDKSKLRAFQLQLAHVADKPGSLYYFMHNAFLMKNLRKEVKHVADVDMGGECLKFGYTEISTFYFITSREVFQKATSALTYLFRKLGKAPRIDDEEAENLIKKVAF